MALTPLSRFGRVFVWLALVGCSDAREPAAQQTLGVDSTLVASRNGQVYYWIGCDNWRSIPEQNRRYFETPEAAEAAGYRMSQARGCAPPRLRGGASPLETGICTVEVVVDGDTLTCREGRTRVRLLLVDAPELAQGGSGSEARRVLENLAPPGSRLDIEVDEQRYDRYDRLLAYLFTSDGLLVNEEIARSGYATLIIVEPNRRYEGRIRTAVDDARAAEVGLWETGGFACTPANFRASRCR